MQALTPQQLFAADYGLQGSWKILIGDETLLIEKVFRYLPGKRLAAQAQWRGNKVLAKLFNPATAAADFEREQQGHHLLSQQQIPAAALKEAARYPQVWLLAYEFLEGGPLSDDPVRALGSLSDLHGAGLIHSDPHADNLLESGGKIYWLDAGAVRTAVNEDAILDNLALYIAQFSLQEQAVLLGSLARYARKKLDRKALEPRVRALWQKRKKQYLQKIFRNCTDIKAWTHKLSGGRRLEIIAHRQFCSSGLCQLLEEIQVLPKKAEFIKKGGSSLVMLCEADGKKLVVKNSRNKSWGRRLRRSLQASRARRGWYFSHLLKFAGVAVPEPLALVEKKWGPFNLESWYVSEYVEGDSLLDVWHYEVPEQWQLGEVRNLFAALDAAGASHGDMKATNLLVGRGRIFVIDYDGMREHKLELLSKRALARDRERFLRNWNNGCADRVFA